MVLNKLQLGALDLIIKMREFGTVPARFINVPKLLIELEKDMDSYNPPYHQVKPRKNHQ